MLNLSLLLGYLDPILCELSKGTAVLMVLAGHAAILEQGTPSDRWPTQNDHDGFQHVFATGAE